MAAYTFTINEKDFRKYRHQLHNAIGIIGGNDGTVNALRDLVHIFDNIDVVNKSHTCPVGKRYLIDCIDCDGCEYELEKQRRKESFIAIGRSNYQYYKNDSQFSEGLGNVAKFPNKKSAWETIYNLGLNDVAPVIITINPAKATPTS